VCVTTVLGGRYYKPETKGLDFDGLMEDIKVCNCFLGLVALSKTSLRFTVHIVDRGRMFSK
jgi:hypothetical protein